MLYITFPLAALIELFAPVILAALLARRAGKTAWLLAGVGVLTFIASQLVHIPLNIGLTKIGLIANAPSLILRTAIVAGLSAGLCEETARAAGYWLLKQRARTWQTALALGAGHGGIESILVGAVVLLTFVYMVFMRNADLSTMLSGSELAIAQAQIADYWNMAWHMPFAGAVERLIAITLHLSLSVLVLQAFTRRNVLYYAGAVLWHALVDALAVILMAAQWNAWAIEGVFVILSFVSLGIILVFRHSPLDFKPEPAVALPATAQPDLSPIQLKQRDTTDDLREKLDRSRFDS